MRAFLKIFSILMGCFLLSFGIIYLVEKEREVCDTVVVMKDDRMYNCAETNTYDGLTHIVGCDGSIIRVPTVDIRTIEKIDTKWLCLLLYL